MEPDQSEGIVLKAIEFRERMRIITVMTQKFGIISLIIKGLGGKNHRLMNLSTPLTRAEFIFKQRKNELWRFLDGTILDLHRPLRVELSRLETAQHMLHRILQTQLPHKPSPHLYALLKSFLHNLKTTTDPELLQIAFTLKFLSHEGQLSTSNTCAHCAETPAHLYSKGAPFCQSCSPPLAIKFSPTDKQHLSDILSCRSFTLLESLNINKQKFNLICNDN